MKVLDTMRTKKEILHQSIVLRKTSPINRSLRVMTIGKVSASASLTLHHSDHFYIVYKNGRNTAKLNSIHTRAAIAESYRIAAHLE